jgi:hypothetical protein
LAVPSTSTRILWMFGFQRRRVSRCECEMLLPKPGFFPQISQTDDIAAKVTARRVGRRGRGAIRLRKGARR